MTPTPDLEILGDVHLERRFRTGVPLHRLGDREEMVWKEFEDSVMNTTAKLHVQMGDIFNEFAVSEATVLRATYIYLAGARRNPGTEYVLIRGNHDASRDADKKSSFDVLQALLNGMTNINVCTVVQSIKVAGKYYGFLPWNPFKSSTELATELLDITNGMELEAVFCHCDVKSYGGTDDNLIPVPVLKHRTKTIYTGHIHLPDEFEQDGVKVVVVGSMQPYAHGEDPGTDWYMTLHHESILDLGSLDEFKNKNLRVLVDSNDQAVPEVDCLSLITKKVDVKTEEGDDEVVEMEEFDMNALFKQSLKEHNVGAEVSDKILARFMEKKNG